MHRKLTCRQSFAADQRLDDTMHRKKRYHVGDQCGHHRRECRIGVPDVIAHIRLDLIEHYEAPFLNIMASLRG